MKRILLFALFLMMPALAPAFAKADLSILNKLEGVSVYSDEIEARIVFRFAKDQKAYPRPVFYERSIQLDIEGSYITPSKRKFDIGGQAVRNVQAFQISPSAIRLRLFLTDDPLKYSERWSGSVNGNLMILVLKRETLPKPQPALVKPVVKIKEQKEIPIKKTAASAIVSEVTKTKSRTGESSVDLSRKFSFLSGAGKGKDKKATSSRVENKKWSLEYKEPTAPEPPDTKQMVIKMVTALSFTLALIFLLSWVAKKYMGRVNGAFGSNSVVKVLATGSIGVKKQVTVVDVAGEVLVLGVSGENITMLTAIDDQDNADRLRRMGGVATNSGGSKGIFSFGRKKSSKGSGMLLKALGFTRIGKPKTASRKPAALFDENNTETFAGNLKKAGAPVAAMEYARNMENREVKKENERPLTREELLQRVSSVIKERNGRLKSA